MYPQWMDLIDNYAPEVLWLDGDWVANSSTWRTPELVAYAFNDGPTADTIVVDDRLGTDTNRKHGSFYTPEYDGKNSCWIATAMLASCAPLYRRPMLTLPMAL